MNNQERRSLRKNRVFLVDNLEPSGRFLDSLYEDGILTETDLENVTSAKTRKERCHTFLSILPTRGPAAFKSFLKALNAGTFGFLADKVGQDYSATLLNHTEPKERICHDTSICKTCEDFLKRVREKDKNGYFFLLLTNHCCILLHNIDPKDVVDQLLQSELITEDELEKIISPTTRRHRCEILFEILLTVQNDDGVDCFKKALQKKYGYIVDRITDCSNRCQHLTRITDDDVENIKETRNNSEVLIKACLSPDNALKEKARVGIVCTASVAVTTNALGQKPYERPRTIELLPKQMIASTGRLGGRLAIAYNHLSTLINQGQYGKFDETASQVRARFPQNYDVLWIIEYIQASRNLFLKRTDSAKKSIDHARSLVPKTKNPQYSVIQLFTAETRMYLAKKKHVKCQEKLDDAIMIFWTDPNGYSGRAAGWLFLDNARNLTSQQSYLDLKMPNASNVYEHMFKCAKENFLMSMEHFKRETGDDGPFGFGYALCRYVILLLRCGENGSTMDTLFPSDEDIQTAGKYLEILEDADMMIARILEMHCSLARCDYKYRKGKYAHALDHAQNAHALSNKMELNEYKGHAENRVKFLQPKVLAKCITEDMLLEERLRKLLNDSSG